MTEIFTASWRTNFDPNAYAAISISRSAPRGRRGYRVYPALAPGPWFRETGGVEAWVARYEREVLSVLDAEAVVEDLAEMAGGRAAVLLCWEPPPPNPDWCHRALVSRWLFETAGWVVPELDHEGFGFGRKHPKYPKAK